MSNISQIQKEIVEIESVLAEYFKSNDQYFGEAGEEKRKRVRDLYEQILFTNYDYACQNDVEQSLWKTVFYKVIENHRQKLRQNYHSYRNGNQSAAEELSNECKTFRKLLQSYSSYYISLINKLKEFYHLEPIRKLLTSEELEGIDTSNLHKSVLSCYRCFIYLGDLTRYHRDLYCDPHQKDWKGATNYYRKASALQPGYGNPHNQLAVLSTYNEDEIETIYQYYRSLVIKHPFNTAADNLLVLFDKNITKYEILQKNQSLKPSRNNSNRTNQDVLKSFITTFVRFQGVIFLRSDPSLLADIKTLVMKDLNLLLLREILSEDELLKLIVINISSISLMDIRRSSQSPSSSSSASTKDYYRLAYLFSCEFAMIIISKALKIQNNSIYLGSVITFLEWLLTQPDISKGFQKRDSRNWNTLWKSIAQLLTNANSSRYVNQELMSLIESRDGLPLLPEEIELKGFSALEQSHQHLPLVSSYHNFHSSSLTSESLRALRLCKLLSIGNALCKKFSIIYFNQKESKYYITRVDKKPKSQSLSPQSQRFIFSNHSPLNNNNQMDEHMKGNSPLESGFNSRNSNIRIHISRNNNSHGEDQDVDDNKLDFEANERQARIEEEIDSYDANDYEVDDELLDEIILFKPKEYLEGNNTNQNLNDDHSNNNTNNDSVPLPNDENRNNQFLQFNNSSNNTANGEFNLFYSGLSLNNQNFFSSLVNNNTNVEETPLENSFVDNSHKTSFFTNPEAASSLWGFSSSFFTHNGSSPSSPKSDGWDQPKPSGIKADSPFPQLFESLYSPYKDWPNN